jgi:hypothetical protein
MSNAKCLQLTLITQTLTKLFQDIIESHYPLHYPSTKRFIICALLYPDTSITPINVEYWRNLIILISNLNDFSLMQRWFVSIGTPALLRILSSVKNLIGRFFPDPYYIIIIQIPRLFQQSGMYHLKRIYLILGIFIINL